MRLFRRNRPWNHILRLACVIGTLLGAGCVRPRDEIRETLARRILPVAERSETTDDMVRPVAAEQPERTPDRPLPPALDAEPAAPRPIELAAPRPDDREAADDSSAQAITLPQAIEMAFRRQPRLRVYLETIQQAKGLSDIAFAPFLPMVSGGYSAGGFDLTAGGLPVRPGGVPGFNVLPPGFALPVGLNLHTTYELAELKLQWLICDFGRRLGIYNASRLAVDIHQLQADRAFQTVANDVALAYYNVLRTHALQRIANEAVRRADDELDVARKLAKGGVIEREKVLRAEVQLAESQRLLDASNEGVGVALAALNLAIGLNSTTPIRVVESSEVPPFAPTLDDCLRTAIDSRREFQVARTSIAVAQEGKRVTHADFAPRIVAEGALFDLKQQQNQGRADIALGFIKLDWTFFEGGKRIAANRVADSKMREAMAQAESIADTIAFQVNESYRRLATARLGIDRARPAVDQARENYRLVRARAADGDATPSEITDAETALTRAQQNFSNSIYDYLTAIAKIEYAMGIAPTPGMFDHTCPNPSPG
jgi:outer membrane protein TolC